MKLSSQKLLLIATAASTTSTLWSVDAWSLPSRRMRSSGSLSVLNNNTNSGSNSGSDNDSNNEEVVSSDARRQLFRQSVAAAAAAVTMVAASGADPADAACIQGDLRATCIGKEKIPYDQAKFAKIQGIAPITDGPTGLNSAIEILRAQRAVADNEIRHHIQNNELEKAGVRLLGLIPYVTKCGFCVVNDLCQMSGFTEKEGSTGMAIPTGSIERAKEQAADLNRVWSECDVAIAKGIRGELGDSEATQETILASLKVALVSHNEFLGTAEAYSRM